MKVLYLALLLHVELTSTQLWRCDYTYYQESGGWFKFHEARATWHEGFLQCHYEGAVLASPSSKLIGPMKSIIQKSNTPLGKVFTGIHATYSNGDFSSIEGVPLSNITHQWAEGEPDNNADPESCIALNQHGTLEDVNCNWKFPYICYKKNNGLQLNNCGTTDNEYTLDTRTGSCYKFHRFPHTWSRAYKICNAEGGFLAVINSETEAEVIRDILVKNPENTLPPTAYKGGAIIGYRDEDEHGQWITVHGQSLSEAGYDKFAPNQPDNRGGNQNCGQVFRSGLLDDIRCNDFVPFICEKDPYNLIVCGSKA